MGEYVGSVIYGTCPPKRRKLQCPTATPLYFKLEGLREPIIPAIDSIGHIFYLNIYFIYLLYIPYALSKILLWVWKSHWGKIGADKNKVGQYFFVPVMQCGSINHHISMCPLIWREVLSQYIPREHTHTRPCGTCIGTIFRRSCYAMWKY